MLEISIRTVLILARQRARRPRKRQGSAACTEKGRGSGITRSQPWVSVSHIWIKVGFPERRDSVGKNQVPVPHGDSRGNLDSAKEQMMGPWHPICRHASSDEVNGVESRPKYDESSLRRNCGIVSAGVAEWVRSPAWRHSSHSTQGWPVMGSAAGHSSNDRIGHEYKTAVMPGETSCPKGKENSLCIPTKCKRRIASAFH